MRTDRRANQRVIVAVIIGLLGVGIRARAEVPPGDRAAAKELFDAAKALYNDDKFEDACPKFAAAARLDPTVGRLLNTGLCYEKLQRTHSAWIAFDRAAQLATTLKDPKLKDAEKHRDTLAPLLMKVSVTLADAVDGEVVSIDGVVLKPGDIGVPLPLDPGDHVLAAMAPGYLRSGLRFSLTDVGTTVPLAVPALRPIPPPKFDADAATAAVKAVTYSECGVGAAGKVAITFTGSGTVVKVTFDSTGYGFTVTSRACVERHLKGVTIAKFSGPDQAVGTFVMLPDVPPSSGSSAPTAAPAPSAPPPAPHGWYCADFGKGSTNCYRAFAACRKVADGVTCVQQARAACVTSNAGGAVTVDQAEARGWCRMTMPQCQALGIGKCGAFD